MRKEGIIIVAVGITLLFLSANISTILYFIFNTFALFLLAGVIPGTEFAFSSGISFFIALTALVALVFSLFRDTQPIKQLVGASKRVVESRIKSTRRSFRQLGT